MSLIKMIARPITVTLVLELVFAFHYESNILVAVVLLALV
jgi:hypothetical protein